MTLRRGITTGACAAAAAKAAAVVLTGGVAPREVELNLPSGETDARAHSRCAIASRIRRP